MSYRKVTVDGQLYEYLVGRSYIKIKGVGAFDKYKVGYVINDRVTKVSPAHIVAVINKHNGKDDPNVRLGQFAY